MPTTLCTVNVAISLPISTGTSAALRYSRPLPMAARWSTNSGSLRIRSPCLPPDFPLLLSNSVWGATTIGNNHLVPQVPLVCETWERGARRSPDQNPHLAAKNAARMGHQTSHELHSGQEIRRRMDLV